VLEMMGYSMTYLCIHTSHFIYYYDDHAIRVKMLWYEIQFNSFCTHVAGDSSVC